MSSSAESPAPADAPAFRWIPVRSLGPRHRPRIERHLLALDERDRYLRFGHAAGDERIRRYVQGLDFERDELFGIFNRRLELVAMAHLAIAPASSPDGVPEAEFAVSVRAASRGRGYGLRLFQRAITHARHRGLSSMIVHALSENTPMLRLARRAGATVERSGSEAEGRLALPPEDWSSWWQEWLQTQAAEWNYQMKAQVLRLDAWLEPQAPRRGNAEATHPTSR